MPLITTEITRHAALDALSPERRRDWLLAQLEFKHSQEVWKLLQPLDGQPSQRYVIQCLGITEHSVEFFGTPQPVYRMHTLMAYIDEPNCLVGDIVASEALGDPATLYNAQYINVPLELTVGEPSLKKQVREYKRRIFDIGTGISQRQMIVWERVE